jgi:hypothetical protein
MFSVIRTKKSAPKNNVNKILSFRVFSYERQRSKKMYRADGKFWRFIINKTFQSGLNK